MFTLKIASRAADKNANPYTAVWLPGVKAVSRIGTGTVKEVFAPRMSDGCFGSYHEGGLSDYTRIYGESAVENYADLLLTLLWVDFTHGRGSYLLVELAWLLSPTGDTVDRITP